MIVRLVPALALALSAGSAAAQEPEIPYLPTPHEVVEVMLGMAEIRPDDVVYDLGCGDGRIVIAALQRGAARGVCVDIDPARIAEARVNTERAGLAAGRIRFVEGDLFAVPIGEATVVTLYLLPSVNLRLRPRLLTELKPGTRVVSHDFDMGPEWKPEREERMRLPGYEHKIFRWTIPDAPSPPARVP